MDEHFIMDFIIMQRLIYIKAIRVN